MELVFPLKGFTTFVMGKYRANICEYAGKLSKITLFHSNVLFSKQILFYFLRDASNYETIAFSLKKNLRKRFATLPKHFDISHYTD